MGRGHSTFASALFGCAFAFAFTFMGGRAHAQEAATCASSAESAQTERDAGHLLRARAALVQCAQDGCPAPIKRDCVQWLEDVNARMPAVRLRTRGPDGADLDRVSITIDDKPLTEAYEGRFVDIEPGPHVFRFQRAGYQNLERRIVVAEREKNAVVDVQFVADAGPKPLTTTSTTWPLLPLALAGVGLVGFGGFTFFGLKTNSEYDRLDKACAPRCTDAQLDDVRTPQLIANISLGIGVIALGAAAILWLTHKEPTAPREAVQAQINHWRRE